jgi:Flp pilus assembly protein TadG
MTVRVARRVRDEAGSAAVFVIGMAIVLFVCAGLVIDGGLAINARMRVADDAEQASRVGADSLDIDQLRATGAVVIDEPLARQRAAKYLEDRGYAPGQFEVDPQGGTVAVTVHDTTSTIILGLVNIPKFNVSASATATPETGPK